jgi:hypothetical protein
MKRVVAGGLTALIAIAMIGLGLARHHSPTSAISLTGTRATRNDLGSRLQDSQFAGASDRIEGLIESARQGDVASYLAAFGGSLHERLDEEAKQLGRPAFADRLRNAAQARKSHAVYAAEPEESGLDRVRITVEIAYRDRIERQTYRLARLRGSWLVTEMTIAHDIVPRKSLGSLATYEPPEGVPVAADIPE